MIATTIQKHLRFSLVMMIVLGLLGLGLYARSLALGDKDQAKKDKIATLHAQIAARDQELMTTKQTWKEHITIANEAQHKADALRIEEDKLSQEVAILVNGDDKANVSK